MRTEQQIRKELELQKNQAINFSQLYEATGNVDMLNISKDSSNAVAWLEWVLEESEMKDTALLIENEF